MFDLRLMLLAGSMLLGTSNLALAEASLARHPGPSVVIDLGNTIKLHDGSSLRRDWILINEPRMPLRFEGPQGIDVNGPGGRSSFSRNFEFQTSLGLIASDAVTAFEVRYVVLDPFGMHLRTLSRTILVDLQAGAAFAEKPVWPAASPPEAANALTSIAFVASARLADGKVLRADLPAVLREAQKVSDSLELQQLAPERSAQLGSSD